MKYPHKHYGVKDLLSDKANLIGLLNRIDLPIKRLKKPILATILLLSTLGFTTSEYVGNTNYIKQIYNFITKSDSYNITAKGKTLRKLNKSYEKDNQLEKKIENFESLDQVLKEDYDKLEIKFKEEREKREKLEQEYNKLDQQFWEMKKNIEIANYLKTNHEKEILPSDIKKKDKISPVELIKSTENKDMALTIINNKEVLNKENIIKKRQDNKTSYITPLIRKQETYCDIREEIIEGKRLKVFYADEKCSNIHTLCIKENLIKNYNNNVNKCIEAFIRINKKKNSVFTRGNNGRGLIKGKQYFVLN